MIFVSGPYSHADVEVKNSRAKLIAQACLNLMKRGESTISPLTFGLSIIEKTGEDLPDDYEYWGRLCEDFVRISSKLYILDIDGWNKSGGVLGEIRAAISFDIPVYLVHPETLDIIERLDIPQYKELEFDEDMMVKTSASINLIKSDDEYAQIAKVIKMNLKPSIYSKIEKKYNSCNWRDDFDVYNFFTTSFSFINNIAFGTPAYNGFNNIAEHPGSDSEKEYVVALEINSKVVLLLHSVVRGSIIRIQDDNYTITFAEVLDIYRNICLVYNQQKYWSL